VTWATIGAVDDIDGRRAAVPRALRPGSALKATLIVALALASLAAAVFAITLQLIRIGSSDLSAAAPPPPQTPARTPAIRSLADVAAGSLDRVVTIEVAAGESNVALGTGWLLDAQGDYVTNEHVVAATRNLRVVDRAGAAHAGVVLGVDTNQDLAVVRAADLAGGTPLPTDASPDPPLPERVVVLASARATSHGDSTEEQLVRLHQSVPLDSTDSGQRAPGQPAVYDDMMVLKGASIYAGNSGGPVLDDHGDVIGIVTLAAQSTPQAFAIPLARSLDELHSLAARAQPAPAG
jgi:S1-C subfamily serine protease